MRFLELLPALRNKPRCRECFFILLPEEKDSGWCVDCTLDFLARSFSGEIA